MDRKQAASGFEREGGGGTTCLPGSPLNAHGGLLVQREGVSSSIGTPQASPVPDLHAPIGCPCNQTSLNSSLGTTASLCWAVGWHSRKA